MSAIMAVKRRNSAGNLTDFFVQKGGFNFMKNAKRNSASGIMRGVGIAMTIGGATAIVGSTMISESRMVNMKKNAGKVIKTMSSFMGNM